MKRLIVILLALLLLAGCGGPAAQAPVGPAFAITDGAYDCTPDEFVQALREYRAGVENVDFIPVDIPLPSETETDVLGDYRLILIPRRLFLDLGLADDGRVYSATIIWPGGAEDTDNAGLLAFCLIHMLMPSDADKTVQDFGYAAEDQRPLEVTGDGTYLFYMYGEKSGNRLEIRPAAE